MGLWASKKKKPGFLGKSLESCCSGKELGGRVYPDSPQGNKENRDISCVMNSSWADRYSLLEGNPRYQSRPRESVSGKGSASSKGKRGSGIRAGKGVQTTPKNREAEERA